MRIGVLIDSACDLPKSFIDQHGIIIMPVTLRIGEEVFEDRRDPLQTQNFYDTHLDEKTETFAESIPYSIEQLENLFLDRLVIDFDYVFCMTITAQRSMIYDNANKASLTVLSKYRQIRRDANIQDRFGLAVVSSRSMFTGQAVQVAEVVRLIEKGTTPSEIGSRLRDLVEMTQAYVIPADLFHIYTRGSKRGEKSVGWGAYTFGSMLDVKPIIHFNQDESAPVAKVRGFNAACEKLLTHVATRIRNGLEVPYVAISFGGPIEQVPALPGFRELKRAATEANVEVLISPMSTSAAVNVGPGAVSVGFVAPGQMLK